MYKYIQIYRIMYEYMCKYIKNMYEYEKICISIHTYVYTCMGIYIYKNMYEYVEIFMDMHEYV